MRILAIRGQNLASLEREFEVALDAEPLASAGLFAITGNTGAGKSTLLDAMCAALFDRTPRLEGRSPFKVGRGDDDLRVGAFDVRALLRRGAGEGWAEVDFEGKDRRRYRARWEVHRARKRAEGKLQDQQMLFTRLAGMRLPANGLQVRVVPTTVHWVGSTTIPVRCPVCALTAPRVANSSEKSPPRIAVDGTLKRFWSCLRSRYPSQFDMKSASTR